ncbi:hypothetical protein TRIUR3_29026 [Triticum urartu]|uniref:Uncharacterized protein n=1 Tax=Triticum urartu TaxID=4572 RepID=M7YZ72_TRIUA|nr:hypothetical protein TRIUR3_29026 [Triticum urartu]
MAGTGTPTSHKEHGSRGGLNCTSLPLEMEDGGRAGEKERQGKEVACAERWLWTPSAAADRSLNGGRV